MSCFRKIFLTSLLSLACLAGITQQTRFSLATDINGLRSIKKQQQYWAIGQTVIGHFHITPKEGIYAWLVYYTNGKFRNELTAIAKQPLTNPQQIDYTNKSKMSFRHISFGWKRYLAGTFNAEATGNLYGFAGLGLMIGRVENTHSVSIDTSDYQVPVLSGIAHFKRLTADLGLGYERPLGADVYLYFEGRTLVPITDYPSYYIFINKDAPLTATFSIGLRILFD